MSVLFPLQPGFSKEMLKSYHFFSSLHSPTHSNLSPVLYQTNISQNTNNPNSNLFKKRLILNLLELREAFSMADHKLLGNHVLPLFHRYTGSWFSSHILSLDNQLLDSPLLASFLGYFSGLHPLLFHLLSLEVILFTLSFNLITQILSIIIIFLDGYNVPCTVLNSSPNVPDLFLMAPLTLLHV